MTTMGTSTLRRQTTAEPTGYTATVVRCYADTGSNLDVQCWSTDIDDGDITEKELESGMEINQIYEILDEEMQTRWKLVSYTRKQYLDSIKKILANQYVLVV